MLAVCSTDVTMLGLSVLFMTVEFCYKMSIISGGSVYTVCELCCFVFYSLVLFLKIARTLVGCHLCILWHRQNIHESVHLISTEVIECRWHRVNCYNIARWLVVEQSSHKWTVTSSGTLVIWTSWNRTKSGTWYMPALDCHSLTFWRWKCHIHVPYLPRVLFDDVGYSSVSSSDVSYCFVAYMQCGLYEINKNNRTNAVCGPSLVKKMFWDWTEATLDWNRPRPDLDLISH